MEPIFFFFCIEILNRTLVDKTDEHVPLNAVEMQAGVSLPAQSLPCCPQDMPTTLCG